MVYELDLKPFREPRGFIKILQWFFAICAFATTASFTTQFGFVLNCTNKNGTDTMIKTINYPFALDEEEPYNIADDCLSKPHQVQFFGNARSDSQYFVCTGVLSFLYAMAAALVYLLFEKIYQVNNKIPLADFVITLILAIFWVSSMAAWGKGVSTLSTSTDPLTVFHDTFRTQEVPDSVFASGINPSFSKLVISILFGVINFVLWSGNLWFLYKETTWFESIMKNSITSSNNF